MENFFHTTDIEGHTLNISHNGPYFSSITINLCYHMIDGCSYIFSQSCIALIKKCGPLEDMIYIQTAINCQKDTFISQLQPNIFIPKYGNLFYTMQN